MKTLLKLAIATISLPLLAGEPADFDIPEGQLQYLYKAEIQSNGGITCEVKALPTGDHKKWGSSILITLSAKQDGIALF